MSYYNDVAKFHRRFTLPVAGEKDPILGGLLLPSRLTDEVFLYRYQFLFEELHELLSAHRARDLPGFADALADLVYVALGTAHLAGLPFDAIWAEVQRANLEKVRARPDDPRSKRGSALDVVKPVDWRPPDVAGILKRNGWAR